MIIGLCGFKESGKSLAASYFTEHGFVRLNFKDGLIAHIKERFPDVLRELAVLYTMTEDELFDKKPELMRSLMVNVGTDDRRKDNPNYWVDIFGAKLASLIEEANGAPVHIVADDVRFQNEYDAIKLAGGVIIRVVNSAVTTGGDHPSETEHLNFEEDFTIEADNGDKNAVFTQVDSIVETIKANVD